MSKMDKLNELAEQRPAIQPVKLFESQGTVADAPERLGADTLTHAPDRLSADAPERTDELKSERLQNPIKMSGYKEYFKEKAEKEDLYRLSIWVKKDHMKMLKRIQYKIYDLTAQSPDASEIMRFVIDEGLPKFEKTIDREREVD